MLTLSIYISQFINLSNFLEKPKFGSIHTQNIYKIIIKILGYFWGVTTSPLLVACLCGTHMYPFISKFLVLVDSFSLDCVFNMRLVTPYVFFDRASDYE